MAKLCIVDTRKELGRRLQHIPSRWRSNRILKMSLHISGAEPLKYLRGCSKYGEVYRQPKNCVVVTLETLVYSYSYVLEGRRHFESCRYSLVSRLKDGCNHAKFKMAWKLELHGLNSFFNDISLNRSPICFTTISTFPPRDGYVSFIKPRTLWLQ